MFLLTVHKKFRLPQKMVTTQESPAHIRPTEDSTLSVLIVFSLQNFERSPCCFRLIDILARVSGSSRGL